MAFDLVRIMEFTDWGQDYTDPFQNNLPFLYPLKTSEDLRKVENFTMIRTAINSGDNLMKLI